MSAICMYGYNIDFGKERHERPCNVCGETTCEESRCYDPEDANDEDSD